MPAQRLGNPYRSEPAGLTGGDPFARVMGHYGKGTSMPSLLTGADVPGRGNPAPPTAYTAPCKPGRIGGHGSRRDYGRS